MGDVVIRLTGRQCDLTRDAVILSIHQRQRMLNAPISLEFARKAYEETLEMAEMYKAICEAIGVAGEADKLANVWISTATDLMTQQTDRHEQ